MRILIESVCDRLRAHIDIRRENFRVREIERLLFAPLLRLQTTNVLTKVVAVNHSDPQAGDTRVFASACNRFAAPIGFAAPKLPMMGTPLSTQRFNTGPTNPAKSGV